MRLERFINTLIPVDYVLWAEYIPKSNSKDYSNITQVHVLIPDTVVTTPIVIKGNKLEDFHNWFSHLMKTDKKECSWTTKSESIQIEKKITDESPIDMSPKFCHVSKTSDGSEHVSIWNGNSSASEDLTRENPDRMIK